MHEHPKPGAKSEIAQVFRRFAQAYRDKHPLADPPARVLRDLEHCRTAALGGHLYRCNDCSRQVVLYNSCLNRHCPTCQGPAQYRWIEQRQRRSISDEKIIFRTRGEKTCSLAPEEFIRRFLLHVLPHQFFKIRHYGLLAPANVSTRLVRAQEILGPVPAEAQPVHPPQTVADDVTTESLEPPSDAIEVRNGPDAVDRTAPVCPHCGGRLVTLDCLDFIRQRRRGSALPKR